MTTTQKRAKTGGEIGANGSFYEGGKFIATTDHAKKLGIRKATGRVEIENRVWVDGREGLRPLFPLISGIETPSSNGSYSFNANLRGDFATADSIATRQARINLWNSGCRWIPATESK